MFNSIRKIFRPSKSFIIVVSGLPRSGTSMMMKMLEAGGLEILTDNERAADEDNPKGYYEFERVKKMKEGDVSWIGTADGKVVKVISALLGYLPKNRQYRVIFMEREIDEVLASQKKMLVRRGESADKVDDKTLAGIFADHLKQIKTWLGSQPNIKTLFIRYSDLISDPSRVDAVIKFLDLPLNADAMRVVPDKELYRNKKQ
jgi:hypothetical protein